MRWFNMGRSRRILVLLLVLILIAMPVYAKDNGVDELKFEDIEKLMNRYNPSIQVNKNIIKNLEDGIDAMEDARADSRDLEDAIDDLADAVSGLNKLIDGQNSMIDALNLSLYPEEGGYMPGQDDDLGPEAGQDGEEGEEGDDSEDGQPPIGDIPGYGAQADPLIYEMLGLTIRQVQGLYEMNIATLEQNRDMLRDQLDALEKLPSQIMELEKTILQLEMANESIVLGAQNLYLGYHTLARELDGLVQNLELLENQINIMTLQEELGMITSLDLMAAQNQKEALGLGVNTMEIQLTNLLGQLNLMFGQDFDVDLQVINTIAIDEDEIDDMDYKDDLKKAKRKSYAIKLKDYDYEISEHNLWWARRYGKSDDRRSAERDLENAEIELAQENKNVELAFHNSYENVQSKFSAYKNAVKVLEYEEKLYEILQLKDELGMISKISFKQGQVDYNGQINKFTATEQDLFQAWLSYEALLEGVDCQQ